MGITLAAPIGPASVTVIQGGLSYGFRRAFLTGLGVTFADLTYMLVAYLGLARFIETPAVKVGVWTLGAAALIYLGVQSLREGGQRFDFDRTASPPNRPPFLVGFVANASNPLAVLFWLGIFGSLISSPAGAARGPGALGQGLAILAGILSWHTFTSVLTNWGKRYVNERSARVIAIVAGAALVLFGLRFGYQALMTLFS